MNESTIQRLILFGTLMIFLALMGRGLKKDHEKVLQKIHQLENNNQTTDSLQRVIDSLHSLSWENIEYWIDTLDIKHKEVVLQQIHLETGNLTSDVCLQNNNLFGMKQPRVRETTALGTKRGHAYYNHYIDSIKDYALWQQHMYEDGDYYAFLGRVGYAEATHYIKTLKSL